MRTKNRTKNVQWDDRFFLRCYELARSGLNDIKIASVIGVETKTFTRWVSKKPALAEALFRARDNTENGTKSFCEYIYHNLPPELQEVWERVLLCDKVKGGFQAIELMLEKQGIRAKQQLFIYALVHSNFNQTEACRILSLSLSTVKSWIRSDYEFAQLVEQINQLKGDFFESALIDLVNQRDLQAVIFANRTFNRERGYGDKVRVEMTGNLNHNHVVSTTTLRDLEPYLPLDVKKEILLAIRRKQEHDVLTQKEGLDEAKTETNAARILPPFNG